MQSLFQINSKFQKFLRPQFNILHLPLKYLLLNYQNISIQISPWMTTAKTKAYCSMTPIPYNYQLHEPLLFYLRNHELYYISFYVPRYNQTAIFIDYQEWYNSSEISFYRYLKLIKAYQMLVQDVNNHPILIVMPTGYINYFKWFHRQREYWSAFEPHIFKFVSKMFPDVHICPVDQSHTQVLIPLHYPFQTDASCLVHTQYGLLCKFLQDDYFHFRY